MVRVASWVLGLRRSHAAAALAGPGGRLLAAAAGAVSELLFPPHCFLCGLELGAGEGQFCRSCHRALISGLASPCPRCARPVPPPMRAGADGCARCVRDPMPYGRTVALGTYGGAMRDLVLRMKQARCEPLTLAAGRLLAERIALGWQSRLPDIVVPVPMHWLRRLQRGVNASELLAEAVAARLDRPLGARLVRCRRRTEKQGTLAPSARRRNVRGAYAARPRAALREAHVLLVDDVLTTGATASEVARVLRRAGAHDVSVAVAARGLGFD